MKNKKALVLTVLFYVLLFLSLCVFMSTLWTLDTFGSIKTDQILYTLLSSLDGTDSRVVFSYLLKGILVPVGICCLFGFLHFKLKNKVEMKVRIIANVCVCITLVFSLYYADSQFEIVNYVNNSYQKTDIYTQKKEKKKVKKEEYIGDETIIYQNPGDAIITGDDTNNLIYIYLESYENTFADRENGGLKDINCLPELTQLAKDNISFSNTDKLGGPIAFTGTTWTIASMTAQTTGLPLKTDVLNNMDQYNEFMPGAITIGDILHKRGYIQELLIGSQKKFAGTDKLFEQHGQFNIVDFDVLNAEGRIQNDEKIDWGANDNCLFRNAREELNKLASTGKKFNFTMATIDCHMPYGYKCKYCSNNYSSRYENIYACQSVLVNEFINWCKEQTWFNNTTIVIVGDHPTMASEYTGFISNDYTRTTYNCIINSKVTTENIKNRTFTPMDMFPTTLAAMGFDIKGNKLALGTNLFSKLPTVTEKYSVDYIEQEVQKSSDYLDENIYKFNEQ